MNFEREENKKDISAEVMLLAGHELLTPLTAFNLQLRILRSLASEEKAHDLKEDLLNVCTNSEKQIQRMEKSLGRLVMILENELLEAYSRRLVL